MNISELIKDLETLQALEVATPIIIIVGVILVLCIRIKGKSLWSYIFRRIGKDLNRDVMDKIEEVDKKVDAVDKKVEEQKEALDKHIEDSEVEKINHLRQKVIRFSDEIYQGRLHSKESYDEALDWIDVYEDYCSTHPDFPNNKAIMAIENITTHYKKHQSEHSFADCL